MFKSYINFHQTDSRVPSFLGKYIDCDTAFVNGLRFFVADGVTRDFKNGDEFRFPKNFRDIRNFIYNFPDIDKLQYIVNASGKRFILSNRTDLKKVLEEINAEIKSYYDVVIKGPTDYLGKNYLGMTAAGGFIKDNKLKAFNIGDSNIVVLDKFYDDIFKTKDSVSDFKIRREDDIKDRNPFITGNVDEHWNDRNYRSWFRNRYINTSNDFSFGVLNGEKGALDHINYYDWDIKDAKYIFSYTDGYEEVMENKNQIRSLTKSLKPKIKKEGTIIGFIKE